MGCLCGKSEPEDKSRDIDFPVEEQVKLGIKLHTTRNEVVALTSGVAVGTGIKVGDRILSLGGRAVTKGKDLRTIVPYLKGTRVEMKIQRDGTRQEEILYFDA
eukprot:Hpha_TRINITY_DN16622_c4_g9::TRINITY_DN16622_c4_g9_i1::g.182003::m.182003